ncbi:choice-of-anchor I family protein [Thomasclavelia saccharogumia]|uniref:choice-of-anchor I family protein n=1 Tax=Thomasclavelia saccharogumia TaxID=341225 RepID=UPI00047AF77F|nr:choice-of-anchor I family protein [Thomasclavelia saccharogumia]
MEKENNRIIKGILCLTALSTLLLSQNLTKGFAQGTYSEIIGVTHAESFSVDSLTLQPGETTASINLNWYAPAGTTVAKIQFGDKTYDVAAQKLTSPTEVKSDKYTDIGKLVCKTTISNLKPNTKYTYYISNDGGTTWSKEYNYTTPSSDEFTFGFTSDPQIKENKETNSNGWNPSDGTNQTGWTTMMKTLEKQGVDLVVSAGDQVEDQSWGKSSEYEAFFAPEEMTSIPYAPAVGNHDRHYMFADHFNLPNQMESLTEVKTTFRGQNSGTSQSHGNYIQATENEIKNNAASNGVTPNSDGQYDFSERRDMETQGNYYYLYNNVLFVTLNTSAYPGGNDEENADNPNVSSASRDNSEAEAIVNNFAQTLKSATSEYKDQYQWLIVTHHKSTQTVAKHAADSDIENYVDAGFEKLMDEYDVDFVLGGHDHVYSRSYVLKDGQRNSERLDTLNDPQGTIYLTGNCCSDMQYYTPFETLDKNNNADYPILANGKRGSAAYLEGDSMPIGNQEWNQEYSPSYAVFNVENNQISVKVYNLDGDSTDPDSKEIDAFTVTKNSDGGEKTTGYENNSALLALEQAARYDSGSTNSDGGVTEIVDYNTVTGWAYAVNGQTGNLTAIALKDIENKDKIDLLDGNDIDISSLVQSTDFTYGDMTSVAVSHDGTSLVVVIQGKETNANGRAALFDCNQDGTITLKQLFEVGVQPDMVVFTNDDGQILTANEGEPRDGYSGAVDPKGSVSVINTKTNEVKTIDFTAFDSQRDALVEKGIVLKKGALPSTDLEPEYIAVSDSKAYITLQEANAIAKLDLNSLEIEDIYSAGFEDYSKIAIDIDKKDEKYNAQTYDSLKGIRMPDAISVYTVDGIDYLITANEGDSRDWNGYSNEIEVNFGKGKTSPTGKITADNSGLTGKVVFFDSSDYDGLNNENDYLFGGRSSTIFKVGDQSLQEVYTTGNDFEVKTAAYLPNNFNCSNDTVAIDDRSGKKGPEAEAVTIGQIEDKIFAFIGLERIGGVMVYDITDPEKTEFVNYINSRDFSTDIGGDDSPEGIHFISSSDSITGKAQLIVAYEVSGTVGVYDLTLQKNDSEIIESLPDSTIEELDNNQKQAVDTGDSSNFSVMGISLAGTIIIMIILDRKELMGNRD